MTVQFKVGARVFHRRFKTREGNEHGGEFGVVIAPPAERGDRPSIPNELFAADDEAEREMMNPSPSPQFRKFFAQFAHARRVTTDEQCMERSWPSASGARLTLLL